MKLKSKIVAFILVMMGALILFNYSCKTEVDPYVNTNIPVFNPYLTYGTVTDIDSNIYKTIKIGKQTWMVENLKVAHYQNGDPLPNVIYIKNWDTLITGAFCEYNNFPANGKTFGKLYNWYAVHDNRNIAPTGWHVADMDDWDTLRKFLGDSKDLGGKIKETGFSHWLKPNTGATNETGFTALPGGYRNEGGNYYDASYSARFWTNTDFPGHGAHMLLLYADQNVLINGNNDKKSALSVRCIKDN
jgi:uncharacterized protein (TIGR02145 family)